MDTNRTKYKAVFFDWDGTAVMNRTADATKVIEAMKKLLQKNIYLIIVSGTTYENICGGKIHKAFSTQELQHLYLGLGRGNYNYGFDESGALVSLLDETPQIDQLLRLHEACFRVHSRLLTSHGIATDIVFSRPNYCKLDLMVGHVRKDNELFLQKDEITRMEELLRKHKIEKGLRSLLELAEAVGTEMGLALRGTTDAKYLELGFTTKSDNIKYFMKQLQHKGVYLGECCFWGDEFGAIAEGIWGSDSQMIVEETREGDFFSVSDIKIPLPAEVKHIGNGTDGFLTFLNAMGEV